MDAQSEVRPKPSPGNSHASSAAPGASTAGTLSQQKGDVSELVDEAKRTATETATGAGNMVLKRVDGQYHKLGQRLDEMVKDMNQVAESLGKGETTGASNLLHSATRQMERVSGYMQGTSAEDVLSDVNRYAKQHPWTAIIGGMAVGLVASRFLKAAMPEDGGSTGGYESGTSYHTAV